MVALGGGGVQPVLCLGCSSGSWGAHPHTLWKDCWLQGEAARGSNPGFLPVCLQAVSLPFSQLCPL